jgi:hypothetical protein
LPLNLPFPFFLLGGPHVADEARFFSFDSMSRSVVVWGEAAPPVAYLVPGDATLSFRDMRVARGGESWIGFFEEHAEWWTLPGRGAVAVSHRYLREFEVHEMGDLGHLDAAVTSDAFYLLRESVGGGVLYRVSLPADRVPQADAGQLQIAAKDASFLDPSQGGYVIRGTLEIAVPGDSNTFHPPETSVDLLRWDPLGLPAPGGAVDSFLVEPDVPRRFFR